ncbi:hypothetical protein PAMP_020775 [Pampus punctatissimus]
MRRSSLGSGRGRPGFSDPADPTCFRSSALGWYVPSILLFFLMTHSSSSKIKLSRDSPVQPNTDTADVRRNATGPAAPVQPVASQLRGQMRQ